VNNIEKSPNYLFLGSFPYWGRYHFEIKHLQVIIHFLKRPLGPACHIICRGAAFRSIIKEENFFGGFIL
jgi:hypothetical protein